jgi:hypothetical protein
MLQELHAPITIGTTNRISSRPNYSLKAIGVGLLFLGIIAVAASVFIAYHLTQAPLQWIACPDIQNRECDIRPV